MAMKHFLVPLLLGCALVGRAEEETPSRQAEVARTVKGTVVDETGASAGERTVKKGDVFEVASEAVGGVTLREGDTLIKVPADSVKVTEFDSDEALGSPLRIVSAKLGFLNDRRYEVKQEIKKLVNKQLDKGPITANSPVVIPVADTLLRSRARAATYTSRTDANGRTIVYRRPERLYLLVTYEFEGKRSEKSGREGETIKIP